MLIFSLIIFILNFVRVLYLFSKANTYLRIIFKFFWLFSKKHLFLSSKNTISKYKCKPFSICHSPLIALLSNCILFSSIFEIKYPYITSFLSIIIYICPFCIANRFYLFLFYNCVHQQKIVEYFPLKLVDCLLQVLHKIRDF